MLKLNRISGAASEQPLVLPLVLPQNADDEHVSGAASGAASAHPEATTTATKYYNLSSPRGSVVSDVEPLGASGTVGSAAPMPGSDNEPRAARADDVFGIHDLPDQWHQYLEAHMPQTPTNTA